VAVGSSSAIMNAAWVELFGHEQIGAIRGMSSAIAVFLTAAAPVVFGLVLGAGYPPETLILGGAVSLLLVAWPMTWVIRSRGYAKARSPR
jgi:hypothetical protein